MKSSFWEMIVLGDNSRRCMGFAGRCAEKREKCKKDIDFVFFMQ